MYLPEGVPHRPEADSFDLRGSLMRVSDACRAYRRAFLGTFVLTLLLAGAYLYYYPPIYVAEVLMVADPEKDLARDNFYQLWNVFRRDLLANEPELITSQGVLRVVVEDLDLEYDDVYHPFLSHTSHLWRTSLVGRTYRSVKLFFFPLPKTPWQPTEEELEMGLLLNDFQAGAELVPVPESSVGRLKVMAPSARVAEIANKLADASLEGRRERFVAEATRAYDALKVEVDRARDELVARETALQEYSEANGLLLEFEKEKADVASLTELQNRIWETEANISALEAKQREAEAALAEEDAEKTSLRVFELNTLRERMKLARLDLWVSLDDVRQRYRPDSPEVRELEDRIATMDEKIASETEQVLQSNSRTLNSLHEELHRSAILTAAEIEGLRAGLEPRRRILARLKRDASEIPEKVKVLNGLVRDVKGQEQRYQVLTDHLMRARVSIAAASSAPPSMRVVDYASPPAAPVWPKKKFFVPVAVLVGLLAGASVCVLLDLLRGRATYARLAQTRAGLPVYGTLEFGRGRLVELLPVKTGVSADDRGSGDPEDR